jgi:membrane associated rhomboid family serine protease
MFDLNRAKETLSIAGTVELPPVNPVAEFREKLDISSPPPFFSYTLIALNIGVFLLMAFSGVNLEHPTVPALVAWGANSGAQTIGQHEWWRLVTSMFVHIGLLHLAFNMFVLWKVGPFVESLVGNLNFLLIYMVAGLAGSVASSAWHPYVTSAGASGAIFGVYGALLAIAYLRSDAIPLEVLSPLTKSTLFFLAYNLVFGLAKQGIDMSAHIGGLAAGFVCGLLLSRPLTFEELRPSGVRQMVVVGGAALIFAATAFLLPHPVDLQAELRTLGAVEKTALAAYSSAVKQAGGRVLGDAHLADQIEKEIIPAWSAERNRLAALGSLPERQQRVISLLLKYMDARQQGWTMFASGCRRHDLNALMQANVKQTEAQQVIAQIKALPH